MNNFLHLVFLVFLFIASPVLSKNIFEAKNPDELLLESLNILQKVEVHPPKENLKSARFQQILILKNKRADQKIETDYIFDYLKQTEPCIESAKICENDSNPFISSFYTRLTTEDLQTISTSLKGLENPTFKRAKVIQASFKAWELGVQESEGPNDDSMSGNYIESLFESSGLWKPKRELPDNRVDWAWCAAFVTSVLNQAGYGISFISLPEHINACKEMDKLKHCHPVQVEFILNWARKKTNVSTVQSGKLIPGDILILLNPKNGLASHIGFYIAQTPECKEGPDNCWIYTIEGNAGPFINDKLEDNWNEVLNLLHQEKISQFDYERLLDRATIVKRPLESWDYLVSLD